jgi:NAD(P)H dehydrogenase (quinone)
VSYNFLYGERLHRLSQLIGLVINAMQHGMIYVGTGMLPSANRTEDMQQIAGPSSEALNRVGSFTGPMSANFQVAPPHAPVPGDIQTAEFYGKRIAEIAERWVKAKSV